MRERSFETLDFYERLSLLKRVDRAAYMKQTSQPTRNRLAYYEAAKVLDERQREERRDEEKRAA